MMFKFISQATKQEIPLQPFNPISHISGDSE